LFAQEEDQLTVEFTLPNVSDKPIKILGTYVGLMILLNRIRIADFQTNMFFFCLKK
jgi:hypothetical protein